MFRKTKIALALVAAPAAVLAMGAGVASASATPVAFHYSDHIAGYSTVNMNLFTLNDVRSDVTVPNEPNTVPADSVAVGIVLQRFANTPSATAGLGLVWNDPTASSHFLSAIDLGGATPSSTCYDVLTGLLNGSPSDQWVLEGGFKSLNDPGAPLPPGTLRTIPFITSEFTGGVTETAYPMCVPVGTQKFYLEIHDSTLLDRISFIAGALEPGDDVSAGGIPMSEEPGFFNGIRFHEAGVGVDTTNGAAASDLTPGTLAGFWRDGVTQLLEPSLLAGPTNNRLTLDHFNIREYIGTQDGTSAGAPSLTPSSLGIGSSFTVTAAT